MNADQGSISLDISHHQGNRFFRTPVTVGAKVPFEAKDAKRTPSGREVSRGDLSNA
jgi:hypothetical protein